MSEAKAKYLAAKAAFEETFEKHLQNGVEFISDQVFIDPEVEIAPGAVILPGCILRGKTVIGANCVIGPNTLLENTIVEAGSTVNASQCYDSHLGPNNKIGPFTHVRTGTVTDEGVHLGAYVETKNANFAEGNTVSHLTYIGDADVVHRLQHQPGGAGQGGQPRLYRCRFHHRPRCAGRCPGH